MQEAETAGVVYNTQLSIPIKHMLTILGHKQPATPIRTDTTTASAFVNDTFKKNEQGMGHAFPLVE